MVMSPGTDPMETRQGQQPFYPHAPLKVLSIESLFESINRPQQNTIYVGQIALGLGGGSPNQTLRPEVVFCSLASTFAHASI